MRCDWIFLAADSHSARHRVDAVVHEFLIPATQVGVKIPVSPNGEVGQIHTATRLVFPGVGCMWCNGLIDPTELAVGEAVTHFLLATAGLHENDDDLGSVIHRPRTRERHLQDPRQNTYCR